MVRTTLGHKAYYESEFGLIQFDGHVGRVYLKFHSIITIEGGGIWANRPIHSFLVGCMNPCLQGTNVRLVSPQPGGNPNTRSFLSA